MSSKAHLELKDFSPDNYHLLIEKPDKNFSPRRNYAVIAGVLAENDKMQRSVHPKVQKNAENVADILASFAKYKLDVGGEKKIEGWLGKSWMNKIYGEKLLAKIRVMDSIRKMNIAKGNTMLGGNFYLN